MEDNKQPPPTNASNKSEEELKHAKNELNRQAAEMNELKEWKAQQEAFNCQTRKVRSTCKRKRYSQIVGRQPKRK